MANENRGRVLKFILSNYLGVTAVLIIFFLIMPMPKIIIDLLMIMNLALSFIVLLSVLYTPRASDFQTFPRIILFQTMFGLAINVSSTRLILSGKPMDMSGQSSMVQSFANIVAGNNLIIGTVIFVILVVVQVVVITKGAGRISEVAARFSLDSMSQKFFDVDNRLNHGDIDDQEALRLKDSIRREIDFYSNMDGASKFVSGNVKAGIFITVVNIVGGIIIGGIAVGFSDFGKLLNCYANLTIGDGLMSQMPSLIISFATGILVTGTKSDEDLGDQLKTDFTRSGYIYEIVGAVLIVSGIGLRNGTQWLLIPIGALFIYIGYLLSKSKEKEAKQKEEQQRSIQQSTKSAEASADSDTISMLDTLSLELGYALIPLVKKDEGAELLERILRIRNEAKLDMGFVIPRIHILDNMTLKPNDYSFKIKGIEAGHANIRLGYYMCMDTGAVIRPLQGEKTKDPAFGMDAIWLPEDQRKEAEDAGYVVVDPPTVIATHLTEIIRAHAAELLGLEELESIINTVREKNKVLVSEVIDNIKIPKGLILKVLQNLLRDRVSIRNIVTIFESLANYYGVPGSNVWTLTEKVRQALGLQICMQYANPDTRHLPVMRLSNELSQLILDHSVVPNDGSTPYVALDPVDRRRWISAVSGSYARVSDKGFQPIILCVSQVRQLVQSALEMEMPGIVVISDLEIYAAGKNVSVDIIDDITDEVE